MTATATTTRHVPTYCYNCVAGPDLLSVKVTDGVATEIGPNFDGAGVHPALGRPCVKAYGLVQKTQNPNRILAGSDGGFYVSYDRGKTADHYMNIPVGEFYAIDAAGRFAAGSIFAGNRARFAVCDADGPRIAATEPLLAEEPLGQ